MDAEQVRQRHETELLSVPHVVGVGTSKDDAGGDVIVVFVTSASASVEPFADRSLPRELDGVPVRIVEVGYVGAQERSEPPT